MAGAVHQKVRRAPSSSTALSVLLVAPLGEECAAAVRGGGERGERRAARGERAGRGLEAERAAVEEAEHGDEAEEEREQRRRRQRAVEEEIPGNQNKLRQLPTG